MSADTEECSICLENFTKSKPATVTICNHRFHKKCIQKWQNGSQCPLCKTALSRDAACFGRKKRKSGEAGNSEEPESSQLNTTPGISTRTEPSESSLRRSTRNGKAGGPKGTKGTYEEEDLKYVPVWDVHTTDHPSDPLVAQNLAEGLILPSQAADLAEMSQDLLKMGGFKHLVTGLNFFTAHARQCKCTELSETVQALKDQLASADARAAASDARAAGADARAAEADARTADADARAACAEVMISAADARAKAAVEEFKASEEYKNAMEEYAFASFNEMYALMKRRNGPG